jgi:hypothetical protein
MGEAQGYRMFLSTRFTLRAGDGDRTRDDQLGKLALYH